MRFFVIISGLGDNWLTLVLIRPSPLILTILIGSLFLVLYILLGMTFWFLMLVLLLLLLLIVGVLRVRVVGRVVFCHDGPGIFRNFLDVF